MKYLVNEYNGIPGEPLYPQDYFKQRNPSRLKKIKEMHEDGKYLSLEDLTNPTMTE